MSEKILGPVAEHTFTLEEYEEAATSNAGYCVVCGAWRDCCEPDARRYKCDECGAEACYGADELLLMGLVK